MTDRLSRSLGGWIAIGIGSGIALAVVWSLLQRGDA